MVGSSSIQHIVSVRPDRRHSDCSAGIDPIHSEARIRAADGEQVPWQGHKKVCPSAVPRRMRYAGWQVRESLRLLEPKPSHRGVQVAGFPQCRPVLSYATGLFPTAHEPAPRKRVGFAAWACKRGDIPALRGVLLWDNFLRSKPYRGLTSTQE